MKMPRKIASHFKNKFVAGLIVLVPIIITFWVISLLIGWFDKLTQPLFELAFGRRLPGVGIIAGLFLIYLTGLLTSNMLGGQLLKIGQAALLRIPLVKTIYYASSQLVDSFSGKEMRGFKRVVAIEYPRPGILTIGFVTGSIKNEQGKVLNLVYLPTTPNPTSGWVVLVPEEQTYELDLSIPAATQLIISGGIISPQVIKESKKA